ncbi:site-specific recombinase [Extensimonas sp. H3M7-6]|uniref:site-specific recombinase n=1 Tax=Extensimonas soli TaxID=3031322 RepID=UPI0023DCA467|nr:site-specific recombinase [Extensimonas sp. H3M7-6]MDF1481078.1 site-specific recombinase [Extensimonas sp. H3M7-6]
MTRRRAAPDLAALLAALEPPAPPQPDTLLQPQAGLVARHLWLLGLLAWVRGAQDSVPAALDRLGSFIDAVQARPPLRARLQACWALLLETVDVTTLLADFGFAPRTALLSELGARLRERLLPHSPETIDAAELFALALPGPFDAQWLQALDVDLLARLQALLAPLPDAAAEGAQTESAKDAAGPTLWQRTLLDAMTYCAGQILATGFAPELRLRMSAQARADQPFHALIREVESLRVEVLHPLRTPERLQATAQQLRTRLEACRAAAATVYAHFEDEGISVGLVFRLRQLRERIVRVRALLDCLLAPQPAQAAARLLAQLVQVQQQRRSLRALFATNASLLSARIAERSAETGEHYITRTPHEYRAMLRMAAGGGALMAPTTLLKFGIYALALSPFWGGFWAGMNYALSFVLIQLLHCTVATKQPAMTAPAMAAKLHELGGGEAVESFVDEVTHLVRSQVAAVLGNVLVVFPAVLALAALLAWATGAPAISTAQAKHVLESLHLLGPSLAFAALTGVLLFASSIVAGWAENAFVLYRLDSALRYHPGITARLGVARAARWAQFLRHNVSGLAANVSLGFMLGLVPALAGFFGLGLDVRHVTLSTGQVAAACAALGWQVLQQSALWWAVATLPLIGALNVGVSFYLAFRVALRARNVTGVERARIYAALRARWRHAPLSFFLPQRGAA